METIILTSQNFYRYGERLYGTGTSCFYWLVQVEEAVIKQRDTAVSIVSFQHLSDKTNWLDSFTMHSQWEVNIIYNNKRPLFINKLVFHRYGKLPIWSDTGTDT